MGESTLHFVDVGVYQGQMSHLLLRKYDSPNIKVHMYEPNLNLVKGLHARFDSDPRAKIYPEGLGAEARWDTLYLSGTKKRCLTQGATVFQKKGDSITGVKKLNILLRSSRDVIKALSPGPIVLYMNCEGCEYNAIPPLFEDDLWKRISVWCVSLHPPHILEGVKDHHKNLLALFKQYKIKNRKGHFRTNQDEERHKFLTDHVEPLIP